MDKRLRINFASPSGLGKTTMAKCISEQLCIPFISGSYRDLVPSIKDIPHSEMLSMSPEQIYIQDAQLLSARQKAFCQHEGMVSDRSFLDSATYFIQKLSSKLPECEVDDFVEKCKVLNLIHIDKLIVIDFHKEYWNRWKIEDNGKRITNRFYQESVSEIMFTTLFRHFGNIKYSGFIDGEFSNMVYKLVGEFFGVENTTDVLILREIDHEKRMKIIYDFLMR